MRNNVPDYFHHFDHLSGDTQLETEPKTTTMEVINPAGESVDVVEHHKHFGELQKSTSSFLRTLEAWRIRTNFSVHPLPHALVVTRSLVAEYVTAYEVGMSAAQDGYNFATSGLSLTTIITSDIGLAERESYIAQMQSFATQGKNKSEQALENMRELRRKLNSHLDRIRTGSEDSAGQDDIAVFEKNLSILHQFEECMDWYIKWWTKTGMTSSHQDTSIAQYARSGGDLRLRGIQLQWKNLQDVYLHYRIEMQKLQDQYSGVFKLVHNLKPSDVIDIPTYPSLEPMLEGRAVQRQGTSKRNARRHSNSPPVPLATADGTGQRILDEAESNQQQASTRISTRQNSKISDQRIVKETVLGDIPQPSVEGLDIQQEMTGFDRQKAKSSKPFGHALDSTSGRSTQSAKSDSGSATMVDNRSTSRRNEESSDGRERSSKKTASVISNPPKVLALDDSSASHKTAWSTKEEPSNHSNSVADRQRVLIASQLIDTDEPKLGKTDKPPSSSSNNGKSTGYHHSSRQLLKTDSKTSHRTQPDPTTSGLKRSTPTNQRTSIEILSDLGDIISSSEKVDPLSLGLLDDIHGPSSNFSNEETHLLAPLTSSIKVSVNRNPSKHSAQARIQLSSPDLGLIPGPPTAPPTNIELDIMPSSHLSTKAVVQHELPNILSKSESESLVPPHHPKFTKAVEQPAQRKNSSQTQSLAGGDWADQQLRRDSPKDDQSFSLPGLSVNVSESRNVFSTSPNASGTRLPSSTTPSSKHVGDNGSTENASESLVIGNSRSSRSGSGRSVPKPEGKDTPNLPIGKETLDEEVRAVTARKIPSKKTSSKTPSNPKTYPDSGEVPAPESHSQDDSTVKGPTIGQVTTQPPATNNENAGCGCCIIM